MTNHKNVRKNLLDLVKTFPHIKDNYNAMVGYYWTIYDNAKSVDDYKNATPAETITRNFRKLVELGMVALPERTVQARKEKVLDFKSEFTAIS